MITGRCGVVSAVPNSRQTGYNIMTVIKTCDELLVMRSPDGVVRMGGDLRISCEVSQEVGRQITGIECNGDLSVGRSASIVGYLHVGGDLFVGEKLTVGGNLTVSKELFCCGVLTVAGTRNVHGEPGRILDDNLEDSM